MTYTAKQILKVLLDLGFKIEDQEIYIRRTYAGRHQLASGTWKWWAAFKDNIEICGSSETCKDIISAHKSKDKEVVIYGHVGGSELIIENKGAHFQKFLYNGGRRA